MTPPRTKVIDVASWTSFPDEEPENEYAFRGYTIGHESHGAQIIVYHSRDLRDKILRLLNEEVMEYVEDPNPMQFINDELDQREDENDA